MADFFKRIEKKYLITKKKYIELQKLIQEKMIEDEHGKSTICNIYFDTEDYALIRHSITKPVFKDKIRLRSYNVPNKDAMIYLEIKRKYDGIVSKRRITLKLDEFYKYLAESKKNIKNNKSGQIKKELDYYFKYYKLIPQMFLSYERVAYYNKQDKEFRITFDTNILARNYDLEIEKGNYGISILNKDIYIMEVKTLGAMPIWFVDILNKLKIYPCGFSKYGEAYKQLVLQASNNEKKII